ncbi:XRE family transcriptional regulator [Bacteroides thetaiotaomicron]|uniref:XRE family transcriptional regulator n=1 Tax=Bacteroides thetaiotaomicron TaxID=818 RepID=UPI0035681E05
MQVNPDVGSMDAVLDKLYGKVGTNKSYISRIEKGALEPGVVFFRIIDALGLKVEIVKPMI